MKAQQTKSNQLDVVQRIAARHQCPPIIIDVRSRAQTIGSMQLTESREKQHQQVFLVG
jgi:7-cyano-7-deazaguanine synthase in queuosine biosynthesis